MKVFNLYNDELGNSNEREGWTFRAAKVGEHIGGELIGAGLYEAEPGNKVWPYHTHHANEEWLLVVRGQPTLRTPEGERQLDEGDVVCSPGQGGSTSGLERKRLPDWCAHALDTRRPGHRRVPRCWEGRRTQRGGRTNHLRPSRPRARLLGRRGVVR